MSSKALFLLLPALALAGCSLDSPHSTPDPTRASPEQQAERARQQQRTIDQLKASQAREDKACKRGNRRACARASAAQAALDDIAHQTP